MIDTGLQIAVFVGKGGGAADKALAALGQIGTQDEIQLSACAADVLDTGGFCGDLTEEIHIHGVVDGNEIVELSDHAHIIGIIHS